MKQQKMLKIFLITISMVLPARLDNPKCKENEFLDVSAVPTPKCYDCQLEIRDCLRCKNSTDTKKPLICEECKEKTYIFNPKDYPDHYYCLACQFDYLDKNCLDCNKMQCTKCKPKLHLYENGCHNCPEFQAQDLTDTKSVICINCDTIDPLCTKCKFDASGKKSCLACKNLNSGGESFAMTADPNDNINPCKVSCPKERQGFSKTASNGCETCINDHCLDCAPDHLACRKCDDEKGYKLNSDSFYKEFSDKSVVLNCKKQCKANEGWEENNTCKKCSVVTPNCVRCDDKTLKCKKCSDEYTITEKEGKGFCKRICPEGKRWGPPNDCVDCDDKNCLVCSDADASEDGKGGVCSRCSIEYFVNSTNFCQKRCKFFNEQEGISHEPWVPPNTCSECFQECNVCQNETLACFDNPIEVVYEQFQPGLREDDSEVYFKVRFKDKKGDIFLPYLEQERNIYKNLVIITQVNEEKNSRILEENQTGNKKVEEEGENEKIPKPKFNGIVPIYRFDPPQEKGFTDINVRASTKIVIDPKPERMLILSINSTHLKTGQNRITATVNHSHRVLMTTDQSYHYVKNFNEKFEVETSFKLKETQEQIDFAHKLAQKTAFFVEYLTYFLAIMIIISSFLKFDQILWKFSYSFLLLRFISFFGYMELYTGLMTEKFIFTMTHETLKRTPFQQFPSYINKTLSQPNLIFAKFNIPTPLTKSLKVPFFGYLGTMVVTIYLSQKIYTQIDQSGRVKEYSMKFLSFLNRLKFCAFLLLFFDLTRSVFVGLSAASKDGLAAITINFFSLILLASFSNEILEIYDAEKNLGDKNFEFYEENLKNEINDIFELIEKKDYSLDEYLFKREALGKVMMEAKLTPLDNFSLRVDHTRTIKYLQIQRNKFEFVKFDFQEKDFIEMFQENSKLLVHNVTFSLLKIIFGMGLMISMRNSPVILTFMLAGIEILYFAIYLFKMKLVKNFKTHVKILKFIEEGSLILVYLFLFKVSLFNQRNVRVGTSEQYFHIILILVCCSVCLLNTLFGFFKFSLKLNKIFRKKLKKKSVVKGAKDKNNSVKMIKENFNLLDDATFYKIVDNFGRKIWPSWKREKILKIAKILEKKRKRREIDEGEKKRAELEKRRREKAMEEEKKRTEELRLKKIRMAKEKLLRRKENLNESSIGLLNDQSVIGVDPNHPVNKVDLQDKIKPYEKQKEFELRKLNGRSLKNDYQKNSLGKQFEELDRENIKSTGKIFEEIFARKKEKRIENDLNLFEEVDVKIEPKEKEKKRKKRSKGKKKKTKVNI